MGGEPIPGPHEIFRLWYRELLRLWHRLPELKGEERAEAIAKLERWLKLVR